VALSKHARAGELLKGEAVQGGEPKDRSGPSRFGLRATVIAIGNGGSMYCATVIGQSYPSLEAVSWSLPAGGFQSGVRGGVIQPIGARYAWMRQQTTAGHAATREPSKVEDPSAATVADGRLAFHITAAALRARGWNRLRQQSLSCLEGDNLGAAASLTALSSVRHRRLGGKYGSGGR